MLRGEHARRKAGAERGCAIHDAWDPCSAAASELLFPQNVTGSVSASVARQVRDEFGD